MIAANFDYESPHTLSEALELLASREDAKILAGGHSLLPAMKLRLATPTLLVDIGRISGLNYIREAGDRINIGATTTHVEVLSSVVLQRYCPLLSQAASQIGDTQVRNCGTIGGSLAQAHPAADYPAAVLVLDAEIVATSRRGERPIRAHDFFTGMFSTALKADEIITEIRVSKTDGQGIAYKKHHHPASGYAVVGVAVRLSASSGRVDTVAVGITGVSHIAYRATAVENALRGKSTAAIQGAATRAADGVEVLGDYYASAEYRKQLAGVLTRRALEQAVGLKRK
jgi:aerobic carbon-monoxide dehydrogenase medium subunit